MDVPKAAKCHGDGSDDAEELDAINPDEANASLVRASGDKGPRTSNRRGIVDEC